MLGQLTPTDPRGIFRTIWHHAQQYKAGVRRRKCVGAVQSDGICLRLSVTRDGAWLSRGWVNACPPVGGGDWVPCVTLPAHSAVALPVKQSLSQTHKFSCFHPSDSLSHPTTGEWASERRVGLSYQLGLKRDTYGQRREGGSVPFCMWGAREARQGGIFNFLQQDWHLQLSLRLVLAELDFPTGAQLC